MTVEIVVTNTPYMLAATRSSPPCVAMNEASTVLVLTHTRKTARVAIQDHKPLILYRKKCPPGVDDESTDNDSKCNRLDDSKEDE